MDVGLKGRAPGKTIGIRDLGEFLVGATDFEVICLQIPSLFCSWRHDDIIILNLNYILTR